MLDVCSLHTVILFHHYVYSYDVILTFTGLPAMNYVKPLTLI